MPIILIGFMGAGKSTIARILDPSFVEMDDLISTHFGLPVSDIFARYGEAAFRRQEEVTLSTLLSTDLGENRVISTGGGIIESVRNQTRLKKEGKVVYLKADFKIVLERIQTAPVNHRPIFASLGQTGLHKLYHRRSPIYQDLADLVLETDLDKPEHYAQKIKIFF